RILRFCMVAEDENWQGGPYLLNLFQDLQAIFIGQIDIEKDGIPRLPSHRINGRLTCSCLFDEGSGAFVGNHLPKPSPDDGVIIGEEYATRLFGRRLLHDRSAAVSRLGPSCLSPVRR